MIFSNTPRPEVLKSLADVKHAPFWLDDPARPAPVSALTENITADLVIGRRRLHRLVDCTDGKTSRPVAGCRFARSGGGGLRRKRTQRRLHGVVTDPCLQQRSDPLADELKTLVRLGHENLDGIEATIKQFNIDCDFIRSGEFSVANEPWQIEELQEEAGRVRQVWGGHPISRSGAGAGAGQLADLSCRSPRPVCGDGQPCAAGVGTEAGMPGGWSPLVRGHPGSGVGRDAARESSSKLTTVRSSPKKSRLPQTPSRPCSNIFRISWFPCMTMP